MHKYLGSIVISMVHVIGSGVAGGAMGAVRPGRHFLGGGKIEVMPKNKK